ncbi:SpoIVB peptidase [Virgibacillus sp. W0181]|uniref:SpoIVB peptidase n=1 Tax=Virgibacillus sp. W0181 TaxID=3391581 RepID=UPI003F466426
MSGLKYEIIRRLIGVLLLAILFAVPFTTPINEYLSIPKDVVTFHNQSPLEVPKLDNVQVASQNGSIQAIDSSFYTSEPGTGELFYEVSGLPIKKVNVSILDDIKVIPGGQSVGVQLHTKGVLVVGHHLVNGKNGPLSPGEDAEIRVGDVILEINGHQIESMEEVRPYVEKAGKENESMDLKIKRDSKMVNATIKPIMDKKESQYQLGLYIRDSAAGIGTVSFYDPKTKKYGALGHVISDMDTKKPIDIHEGTIVKSNVTSIEKGNNGIPGEKQAQFSIDRNKIGSITKNSPFGIFGKLNESIKNGMYDKPMPIALSADVKEGPGKILTVIEGEKVEEFDVEIVSSVSQKTPATKGMVIKVTDPELLKKTGGIVQGMSGSPIIQDGKVIGAVTHVFVNDPTSGYGVHIEWMLEAAGINIYKNETEAS